MKRSDFKKINHNLFTVDYEEYDTEYANKFSLELLKTACSSCRKGNFYGRNLDLAYADSSEIVVRTTGTSKRYATVGIISGVPFFTEDGINEGFIDEVYELIPVLICDGINEKGLVCNVNVVHLTNGQKETTGTNPGKDKLNMQAICRVILDNCASVDEAVALIKDRDVCTMFDFSQLNREGYEFHYMIADKEKTVVIEFVNNEVVVLDDHRIMTNFYLSKKRDIAGNGYERYQALYDNYDKIDSVDSMMDAMAKVAYSKGNDVHNEYFAVSDQFNMKAPDGNVVTLDNYEQYIDFIYEKGERDRLGTIEAMKTKSNPKSYWITMHTSVYDLDKRCLYVSIHENYAERFRFELISK